MREDTEQEKALKARIEQLEKTLAFSERNARHQVQVINVLVAVGIVSEDKLEQARQIVSSLAD